MTPKIRSRAFVRKWAARLRNRRKRIVFTNGCFDILHAGHVDYLERAKGYGDVLIVGLNSDQSTRRLKGRGRPVNSAKDRARVLSGLESVDCVTIFNEDTPINLIRSVKPLILVKGSDWPLSSIVGYPDILKWGGQVKRIKLLKGRSTSGIIKKVRRAR